MERRSDESDEIAAIRAFLRQGGLKVWLTLSVVIALILYTMWPPRGSAAQTIPPSMAYFVTWLNQHNPVYIVLLVLCVYAVLFGAMIYMAHRKLRLFDLRKDHPFYWAKVLFLFVTFIVLWSGFTFYRTSSDYSTLYAVYPTYGATVAKVAAVGAIQQTDDSGVRVRRVRINESPKRDPDSGRALEPRKGAAAPSRSS